MRVHGILAVEDLDRQGEIIRVSGCDVRPVDRCGTVLWADAPVNGSVISAIKVERPEDATSDRLRALLDVARGRPFVAVQCVIVENEDLVERLACRGQLFFGAHGVTMDSLAEYGGESIGFDILEGRPLLKARRILVSTRIDNVILTTHGVHPAQRVFIG